MILAEIGLDMTRFPTAGHLASWAKLCPRTIQSGSKHGSGKAGKANPYLKAALGEAAAAAARTDTFLGERYRRIVTRRGKLKALLARSLLVIAWHLLNDPTAGYHELGSDYHTNHRDKETKARSHIRQLQALGYAVTLTQAARPPDPQHGFTPTRLRSAAPGSCRAPGHLGYFPVRNCAT